MIMKNEFEFVGQADNRTDFQRSLDYFSESDVDAVLPEQKKNNTLLFNLFRYGLMAALIAVFAMCVIRIVTQTAKTTSAGNLYADLADKFENGGMDGITGSEIAEPMAETVSRPLPTYEQMVRGDAPEYVEDGNGGTSEASAKIKQLKAANHDTVAWLTVDGTDISYPVVKAADNDYYLRRDFTGEDNYAGSIFMDYRNSEHVEDNRNTIIYGHNMESGIMFSHVTKFLDDAFFDSHKDIALYTEDGTYRYEIFAILKAGLDSDYTKLGFSDDAEFVDFLYDKKYNSLFLRDIDFSSDERVLTLSTCTNEDKNERYALMARLVSHEK